MSTIRPLCLPKRRASRTGRWLPARSRLCIGVRADYRRTFWRLAGQAKVDGQLASEAEIMATIADRKEQK